MIFAIRIDITFNINSISINKIFYIIKTFVNKSLGIINNNIYNFLIIIIFIDANIIKCESNIHSNRDYQKSLKKLKVKQFFELIHRVYFFEKLLMQYSRFKYI